MVWIGYRTLRYIGKTKKVLPYLDAVLIFLLWLLLTSKWNDCGTFIYKSNHENFHKTANYHHECCLVCERESVTHLTKKRKKKLLQYFFTACWVLNYLIRRFARFLLQVIFHFFSHSLIQKVPKKPWLLCSGSNISLWSVRQCMMAYIFFVIYISIDTRQTERQLLSSEYSRRKAKKCLALYYLYGILHVCM